MMAVWKEMEPWGNGLDFESCSWARLSQTREGNRWGGSRSEHGSVRDTSMTPDQEPRAAGFLADIGQRATRVVIAVPALYLPPSLEQHWTGASAAPVARFHQRLVPALGAGKLVNGAPQQPQSACRAPKSPRWPRKSSLSECHTALSAPVPWTQPPDERDHRDTDLDLQPQNDGRHAPAHGSEAAALGQLAAGQRSRTQHPAAGAWPRVLPREPAPR